MFGTFDLTTKNLIVLRSDMKHDFVGNNCENLLFSRIRDGAANRLDNNKVLALVTSVHVIFLVSHF